MVLSGGIDFELKCPFEAGLYHIHERNYSTNSFWLKGLPSWMHTYETFSMAMVLKTRLTKGFEDMVAMEFKNFKIFDLV